MSSQPNYVRKVVCNKCKVVMRENKAKTILPRNTQARRLTSVALAI